MLTFPKNFFLLPSHVHINNNTVMQECHPTNFYDHTGARRSENSKVTHCLKFVVRAPKRNNQQVASHEKSAAITRC